MKIPTIIPAPELVLENASDSDSSRRVSQLSQLTDYSPSISSSSSASKLKSNPWLSIPCESSIPRRASHAGEYLSPEAHISGSHLDVPVIRERNSSLPSTVLTEELYIMRNFTTNGRKVVNQGDSIRSRRGSRTSISSRGSSLEQGDGNSTPSNRSCAPSPRSGRSTALSSRANSRRSSRTCNSSPKSRRSSVLSPPSLHTSPLSAHSRCCSPCLLDLDDMANIKRVLMLGPPGVGKSSICAQFLSSEHINTYHKVEDGVCKDVSICINEVEARMVFVDHRHGEMSVKFIQLLAIDET